MTSARFWQILPSPCQQLSALSDTPPPPDDVSICQNPPLQSDISFSKSPLHSTLIETLNVYFIQLKTERLGEYINAVVSRIVIGPLDLKQFLPKFKYFCWRQQGLDPSPTPLSATVSISKPPPPSAADVICERSLIICRVNESVKLEQNWNKMRTFGTRHENRENHV